MKESTPDSSLPPGAYRLEVDGGGLRDSSRRSWSLQVNQELRLDVALSVGGIAEADDFSAPE